MRDPFGLKLCFTVSNGIEWVREKILSKGVVFKYFLSALGFVGCRWAKEVVERGHYINIRTEYCIDCSKPNCSTGIPCQVSERDVSNREKTEKRVISHERRWSWSGCLLKDSRDIGGEAYAICPNPFGGKAKAVECSAPKDIRRQGDPSRGRF